MSVAGAVPRGTQDKKPPHGAPCNGCGLCCMVTLCPLGQHIFRRGAGPCPALLMKDGKSACGLIERPADFARHVVLEHGAKAASEAAALLNGAGLGCDARLAGEVPDQAFYARLRQFDLEHRSATRKAKKIWRAP